MREYKGKRWYETSEAAGLLNKSESTILNMIRDGRLEGITSSKPYLVTEASIDRIYEIPQSSRNIQKASDQGSEVQNNG